MEILIYISVRNTDSYLAKAKYLICPVKNKTVDLNPVVVFGETYDELLKRIEKSAGGAKERRVIFENWSSEIIRAAKDCNGSFEAFMNDKAIQIIIMWDKPYQCVQAFREISTRVKLELTEKKGCQIIVMMLLSFFTNGTKDLNLRETVS